MTPAEEDLVRKGMPVAQKAARRIHRTAPHALEESDLLSMAYFGLCQAARRWHMYCVRNNFDENRIDYFLTVYASRRCSGAIWDELRTRDHATRSLRAKSKRLRAAGQDEGATLVELSQATGMTVQAVSWTINHMRNKPVSLEKENADVEILQTTESQINVKDALQAMVQTIRQLPEQEQVILALRYFDGHKGMQLQQIAKKLDVPESMVSSLHAMAVNAVYDSLVSSTLFD